MENTTDPRTKIMELPLLMYNKWELDKEMIKVQSGETFSV